MSRAKLVMKRNQFLTLSIIFVILLSLPNIIHAYGRTPIPPTPRSHRIVVKLNAKMASVMEESLNSTMMEIEKDSASANAGLFLSKYRIKNHLADAVNAVIGDADGAVTIVDDDAAAALSIRDVTILEGNDGTAEGVVSVSLSKVTGRTVTANYATADGSAKAGSDYVAQTGTLTFAPGETIKTITLTVNNDLLDEANEKFYINLSSIANATCTDPQGVVIITDDDAAPTLSIDDVSVTEGNSGTTYATFTVALSAVSGKTVTVKYTTANGTAKPTYDYTAKTGTLTFAPGVTT